MAAYTGSDAKKLLKEEKYDEIRNLALNDKKIASKLVRQLYSFNKDMRARAAVLLGDMEEPAALPGLLHIIKRGISENRPANLAYNYHVDRYIAVDRYIDIQGYERKIPFMDWAFERYIGADKADVAAAQKALHAIAYSQDFGKLLAALKHSNPDVREMTAEILMKRGPQIPPSIAFDAVNELIGVSQKDSNLNVRRYARLALKNMGAMAIEPLTVALDDPTPDQRRLAAWTLYWLWDQYKNNSAIQPIVAAMEQRDIAVIAGAYYYFLELGKEGTEPILIEAMNLYPQQEMIEDFLNCGNSTLEEAARQWAYSHGLSIISKACGGRRRWGSKSNQTV